MPIFMQYDGIKGEVRSAGHEDWIELDTFTFGTGAAATRDAAPTTTPGRIPDIIVADDGDDVASGGVLITAGDLADGATASAHVGGVNVCMGDGSVRFLGDSPDLVLV